MTARHFIDARRYIDAAERVARGSFDSLEDYRALRGGREAAEHDFGAEWILAPETWPRWRVSWNAGTRDLYAQRLHSADAGRRVLVLAEDLSEAEAVALMQGWEAQAAGEGLVWILRRVAGRDFRDSHNCCHGPAGAHCCNNEGRRP